MLLVYNGHVLRSVLMRKQQLRFVSAGSRAMFDQAGHAIKLLADLTFV
jgi:hypothetical protein